MRFESRVHSWGNGKPKLHYGDELVPTSSMESLSLAILVHASMSLVGGIWPQSHIHSEIGLGVRRAPAGTFKPSEVLHAASSSVKSVQSMIKFWGRVEF